MGGGMHGRGRTSLVAAMCLTVTLVACSGSASEPDTGTDPTPAAADDEGTDGAEVATDDPVLEELWARPDLALVAGPVRADDEIAVGYVTDGDRLHLVGIEAATGDERWRQEASPGEVVTGIAVVPRVVDDHPVYLRPDPAGNLFARLVVADPATGEDRLVSDPMLFTSQPGECADDRRSVCVNARSSSDEWPSRPMQLDLDGDGALTERERLTDAGRTRPIGAQGLVDLREGDTPYLAVFEDGRVRWRAPVTELFGDEGYTTDAGWGFHYDEPTERYVGSVGFHPTEEASAVVWDLSRFRMVAFDRGTGELRWRTDAVQPLCSYNLDVPTDEAEQRRAAGETTHYLPVPVRCHLTGTVSFPKDGEGGDPEGVAVTVQGFDPETGETTWEIPVADEARGDLAFVPGEGTDRPVVRGSGTEVVVPASDGPVVVDLASGTQRPPGDDETFWCQQPEQRFDYREPYYFDGEPRHERRGGVTYAPCDVDGRAVADPPAGQLPNGVATPVGDRFLISTPDGLRAFAR
jgi:hypothetical protein